MGYPLPEVGGLRLKPNSKAYALIVQGDTKPLVAVDFDDAVFEQFQLWELACDKPNRLIAKGLSPSKTSTLAKKALGTLQKIAKSCVKKAENKLNQELSKAQRLTYEEILEIQRACEILVAQAIDAMT